MINQNIQKEFDVFFVSTFGGKGLFHKFLSNKFGFGYYGSPENYSYGKSYDLKNKIKINNLIFL